jgi:hypothetical protein
MSARNIQTDIQAGLPPLASGPFAESAIAGGLRPSPPLSGRATASHESWARPSLKFPIAERSWNCPPTSTCPEPLRRDFETRLRLLAGGPLIAQKIRVDSFLDCGFGYNEIARNTLDRFAKLHYKGKRQT